MFIATICKSLPLSTISLFPCNFCFGFVEADLVSLCLLLTSFSFFSIDVRIFGHFYNDEFEASTCPFSIGCSFYKYWNYEKVTLFKLVKYNWFHMIEYWKKKKQQSKDVLLIYFRYIQHVELKFGVKLLSHL